MEETKANYKSTYDYGVNADVLLSKSIFEFEINYQHENYCHATVIIPKKIIIPLYKEASLNQKHIIQTNGFIHGNVPIQYIEENFKNNILKHLKEFLFKFCVVDFIYHQIRIKKITVAGEPRLLDISIAPDLDARFKFEIFSFPEIGIHEWKHFPFKASKRKNYKDLDRQVESFTKQEHDLLADYSGQTIAIGDIVNFNLSLHTSNNTPLFNNFTQNFWFRIGNEETESPLRDIFLGKKIGDFFNSTNKALQEYFSSQIETNYNFHIQIVDFLPYHFFCFDLFKKHFRIKSNKDAHKKLIEVFSYRNDQSQRRSIVEELFKLLIKKHPFNVPRHLMLSQEKILLASVQQNPDYTVYRMENNFHAHIKNLAEKQTREAILIDQLAYYENIDVTHDDIKSYLNLLNRQRTKELVYFQAPSSTINGQEVPVSAEELKHICLREKTINHAIYYLTKSN